MIYLKILISILFSLLFIQCSVVTLPYKAVKTSYKVTKTTVKGAAKVGKVLIPGSKKKAKK